MAVRLSPWSKPSTAPDLTGAVQTFQVTHPFHPWKGREFSLITYRTNWGEDRVYFHDEQGRFVSLPARWTNILPPEPPVVIAEGRSAFRVDDLLQLVALIQQVDAQAAKEGRACV